MSTDSPRYRRAFVVLVLLSLAVGGASLLFTVHEVQASNHQFCMVVAPFAQLPVAKPTSPAQKAVAAQYLWHQRFVQLSRSLGC